MLRYGLRTALPTATRLHTVTGVHPKHKVYSWYSVSWVRAERYSHVVSAYASAAAVVDICHSLPPAHFHPARARSCSLKRPDLRVRRFYRQLFRGQAFGRVPVQVANQPLLLATVL